MWNLFRLVIVCQECLKESEDNIRSYDIVTSHFQIEKCIFKRNLFFDGHGGILYVDARYSNLSVFDCSFYNCGVSGSYWGGAIYGSAKYCTLLRCCASTCHSVSGCHFAFIVTDNIIFYNLSSICNSSFLVYANYDPIYLQHGTHYVENINLSRNRAQIVSGIDHSFQISTTMKFSSIEDSVSTDIFVYYYQGTLNILSFSNIVNNTQTSIGSGIYSLQGSNTIIQYCIFQNNIGALFAIQGSSTQILEHSIIWHPSSSNIGFFGSSYNISFKEHPTYSIESPCFPFNETSYPTYNYQFYPRTREILILNFLMQ